MTATPSIPLFDLAEELGVNPNELQTVATIELDTDKYDDDEETFTAAGAQAMRIHFRGGNDPKTA